MTSRVFLPVIHVDIEHLVFGACLLDQPTSKLVTIYIYTMTPTVLVNGAYLVSVKASILLASGPDNM